MFGDKPDISSHQQFGCEAFLYCSNVQHKDKWDARAEKAIFVGYPTNQKGYLLWCPARGPNAIVSTTNCYFGTRLPYATRPPVEIISGSDDEIPLPERPAAAGRIRSGGFAKSTGTAHYRNLSGPFRRDWIGLRGFAIIGSL